MNLSEKICQDHQPSKRWPSVTDLGQEAEFDVLQQWQKQALGPIKEDIIEWLNITLECNIKPEGFLSYLDDGITLCHLIQLIQAKALECKLNKDITVKCKENAQSGTWFARDNIANFLKWCKTYGVKEECMFETEGLVSHQNEKEVLLCLMELSRIGICYGIKPSGLIAMESEIDKKHQRITLPNVCTDRASVGDHMDSKAESSSINNTVSQLFQTKSLKTRVTSPSSKNDGLDAQVKKITEGCTCQEKFHVSRIAEGNYIIGGKNMFVRLLKGRHLMVRVGGGWDTFQHYISTHDPCRILQFRRDGRPAKSKHQSDFLLMKGKYKHSSQN